HSADDARGISDQRGVVPHFHRAVTHIHRAYLRPFGPAQAVDQDRRLPGSGNRGAGVVRHAGGDLKQRQRWDYPTSLVPGQEVKGSQAGEVYELTASPLSSSLLT